jgi:hypothetical protein
MFRCTDELISVHLNMPFLVAEHQLFTLLFLVILFLANHSIHSFIKRFSPIMVRFCYAYNLLFRLIELCN